MPEVEDGIAVEQGDESAAGSSPVIEGAEEHEEHGKPSRRSQKTKRLATKLTEAEQKIADLERRLGDRREEQPKDKPHQVASDAYPVPEPRYEDFPDPKDFVKAMVKHERAADEWEKGRKAQVEAFREIQQAHNERVEDARERYEDFDEVMEDQNVYFRDKSSQDAFEAAIREDPDGPDVLYYLGKNPDVAASAFAELSPAQVIAKVGRIAAKLPAPSDTEAPPDEKPKPAIIKPVGGSARPAAVDRSNLSFADFKKGRLAGKIK